MTREEVIQKVLGTVQVIADTVVAGGYARDLHHNQQPKDIDILCYGAVPFSQASLLHLQLDALGIHVAEEYLGADYFGSDSARLASVFKYCGLIGGKADPVSILYVDVIVMQPVYHSVQEVLDTFDYNINQYYIGSTGATIYLGKDEGQLDQLRGSEVSPDRRQHMHEIAERLGWRV